MEKQTMDFPTAAQLTEELKRIRYRKGFRKMLRSTISSLLVVAAVAVLISMLFLPVLRVTGTSMTPTLTNDELVICGKRSNFKSGDVVAFYFNNKILLKRVIGVAGDVIYVNGTALEEPYVNELAFGECDLELPYQVPESRIFVMGDHRATSVDSRSSVVGCIAEEYVVGRVILRVWPLKEIGTVH